MQPAQDFDLAVIGGGLIGGAVAWGAARTGARVALLDEGDQALRAARGNFGLIWLQGKGIGTPAYMHWSIRAGELWKPFAEELSETCGFDIGWRRPGGLHFCFSETEIEQRCAIIARGRADGGDIGMEVLDRAAVRAMVPGLGEEVCGASFSPADAHVNPLLLMRALHLALPRRGGAYRPGFAVTRIVPRAGGFLIEASSGETIGCGKLVIAAGLGGAPLAPQVGLRLPVRPERGQILVTERVAPSFPYAANCLRQTEEGTFLFGSSHEEAGFDTGTDVATAVRLARQAVRVLPALADLALVRHWGALRILTPDGLPIYEQSPEHPGAFAVTCHSGVTLASIHALELAPAIAAGALPAGLGAFSSRRFDVPAH